MAVAVEAVTIRLLDAALKREEVGFHWGFGFLFSVGQREGHGAGS